MTLGLALGTDRAALDALEKARQQREAMRGVAHKISFEQNFRLNVLARSAGRPALSPSAVAKSRSAAYSYVTIVILLSPAHRVSAANCSFAESLHDDLFGERHQSIKHQTD